MKQSHDEDCLHLKDRRVKCLCGAPKQAMKPRRKLDFTHEIIARNNEKLNHRRIIDYAIGLLYNIRYCRKRLSPKAKEALFKLECAVDYNSVHNYLAHELGVVKVATDADFLAVMKRRKLARGAKGKGKA